MKFELTERLIEDILFSMENQQGNYFVDAKTGAVVSERDIDTEDMFVEEPGDGFDEDIDRYYDIPDWGSVDGFRLMEQFCTSLRNPPAKQALQDVLNAGKGVFRSFKDVLKRFPEVEKRWFVFKDAGMKRVVTDWYNELRAVWHLAAIGAAPEDREELVFDDFSLKDCLSDPDDAVNAAIHEAEKAMSAEVAALVAGSDDSRASLGAFFAGVWQEQQRYFSQTEVLTAARTVSDEFAGCIRAASVPGNRDVSVLTALFVEKKYRGLGLSRILLDNLMKQLHRNGKRWLVIIHAALPDMLQPLLLECGFEKSGSAFTADLHKVFAGC